MGKLPLPQFPLRRVAIFRTEYVNRLRVLSREEELERPGLLLLRNRDDNTETPPPPTKPKLMGKNKNELNQNPKNFLMSQA